MKILLWDREAICCSRGCGWEVVTWFGISRNLLRKRCPKCKARAIRYIEMSWLNQWLLRRWSKNLWRELSKPENLGRMEKYLAKKYPATISEEFPETAHRDSASEGSRE